VSCEGVASLLSLVTLLRHRETLYLGKTKEVANSALSFVTG